MIRRPPRSTQSRSSAASDVYKRQGNGPPRRRRVAGLRGRSATLGLKHGPDSYGRQQWGILHNGGNPDAATPRELSLIHISEPTRLGMISYAVFCLKKKKKKKKLKNKI